MQQETNQYMDSFVNNMIFLTITVIFDTENNINEWQQQQQQQCFPSADGRSYIFESILP